MSESEDGDVRFSALNDMTDPTQEQKDPKSRPRRSIDFELHDDFDNLLNLKERGSDEHRTKVRQYRRFIDFELSKHSTRGNENKEEIVNGTASTQPYFSDDSDEDTFAEADSDCEPNQLYLDEMIEDSHPERLNLLDYRRSASIRSNKGKTPCSLDISRHDSTISELDLDTTSESERNWSNKGEALKKFDLDSETEREDDTFDISPSPRGDITGRRNGFNKFGNSEVGPGGSMLRQASCKALWGK